MKFVQALQLTSVRFENKRTNGSQMNTVMRHFTEDIRLQKCQKKKNAVALHTTLNQYSRILNWCRLRYQSCARRVSNMNTERASTKHTIHWHRSQLQIQKNRKLFSVSAKRKQCLLAFPKSFSSQSLQKHCRKSKRGGRKKKKGQGRYSEAFG